MATCMAAKKRSGFGINHPTVVPANFDHEPTDDEESDRQTGHDPDG